MLKIHFRDESNNGFMASFCKHRSPARPPSLQLLARKHDPQTQSATHPELKQTPDSHQGRMNQRADVLQGTQTDVCAWKVFNVSSCRVHFSFPLQSLKALRSDKGHKVHQWTVQLWLQCVYLVTLPECTGLWMLLDQPWPWTVSAWYEHEKSHEAWVKFTSVQPASPITNTLLIINVKKCYNEKVSELWFYSSRYFEKVCTSLVITPDPVRL